MKKITELLIELFFIFCFIFVSGAAFAVPGGGCAGENGSNIEKNSLLKAVVQGSVDDVKREIENKIDRDEAYFLKINKYNFYFISKKEKEVKVERWRSSERYNLIYEDGLVCNQAGNMLDHAVTAGNLPVVQWLVDLYEKRKRSARVNIPEKRCQFYKELPDEFIALGVFNQSEKLKKEKIGKVDEINNWVDVIVDSPKIPVIIFLQSESRMTVWNVITTPGTKVLGAATSNRTANDMVVTSGNRDFEVIDNQCGFIEKLEISSGNIKYIFQKNYNGNNPFINMKNIYSVSESPVYIGDPIDKE